MKKQEHLAALKRYISKRGTTQAELARALEMDRTTLNFKLNGNNGRDFTAPEMERLCEYYQIPLAQRAALFFGKR